MTRLIEQHHVERLAARLLEEQGSPEKALAVAKLLTEIAHGDGKRIWQNVAAQLSSTEPKLQQAE